MVGQLPKCLREAFVDGRPAAEMLQTSGTAFLQSFFEMEPTFVVDIMVEVDVDADGGVCEQKPTCLRQGETVGLGIHQHEADAERAFHQHLHCVGREACFFNDFGLGQTLFVVAQHVQDAELDHQSTHLEDDGAKSDEIG